MKIILTGGGTGGHVYPAVAIAEALRKEYPEAEFLYVGVRGRAEEQIVPSLGYSIRYVRGMGFNGSRLGPGGLFVALNLVLGMFQAAIVLSRFKPDAVIGTGGFASVPAVLAALILRRIGLLECRIFIHEQNYAPGRWNRLIARRVDRVWISFEGTRRFLSGARVEFTGYPVRAQIKAQDRAAAREKLGIDREARVLLVFGGSQGARTINRALAAALPELLSEPSIEIFHGYGSSTGPRYDAGSDTRSRIEALGIEPSLLKRYHPVEYFHEIQTYYAAADLVVCRGGAGTINEICFCGRPALIIPKSNLAGEHQVVNSLALAQRGAAEVILERPEMINGAAEESISPGLLARTVLDLLHDRSRLESMSRAALDMNVRPNVEVFVRSLRDELEGKKVSSSASPVVREESVDEGIELTRLAYLSPSRVFSVARQVQAGRSVAEVDAHPLARILRYLADRYLVNPRWQVRNIGVKMVGLLHHLERRKTLLTMVTDRKPDRWWKKLIGGDYHQVGFIRRNALTSLGALGEWDDNLKNCLLIALTGDPYFEVRSEAARTVLELADRIGSSEELCRALQSNLDHGSPEVRWTCLEAAGAVAPGPGSLLNLENMIYHPDWRIRQALIKAVSRMVQRGVVPPGNPILDCLDQLIPTCTDFTPTFPLKRALNELHRSAVSLRTGERERRTITGDSDR